VVLRPLLQPWEFLDDGDVLLTRPRSQALLSRQVCTALHNKDHLGHCFLPFPIDGLQLMPPNLRI
jgi:hypothetical protein